MLHGGDLGEAMAKHGGNHADWLDLSTGINPNAYALPAIDNRFWQALPARADLDRLIEVARAAYRVPAGAKLVAAPGTQALIQWMPRLAPSGAFAVLGPTYNEHARALVAAGRAVRDITNLGDWRESSLIIVNPNNPDGRLLTRDVLGTLAEEAARRGGWLVIDESFIDVAPDSTAAGLCGDYPIVILRSFGKFYGRAGVRLGFVLAKHAIADGFASALGPWAVAGPALVIGAVALEDKAWASAMRTQLEAEATALDDVLHAHGEVVGGTSLYRLARFADATRLHEHLASCRIWVRRFDWDTTLLRFGLPPDGAARGQLAVALAAFRRPLIDPHDNPHGMSTVSPSRS